MADNIIEQITPHIHEILRIVLVKGRTLREFPMARKPNY